MSLEEIPVTAEFEGREVVVNSASGQPESQPASQPVAPILEPLPYATELQLLIPVAVMRSPSRRKCSRCGRRRITYQLRALSGWAGASAQLCSTCSGLLVHGGRRHDDEETR